MNFDPYTGKDIHHGGIWNSGCLNSENDTQTQIYAHLQRNGWTQQTTNHKIWNRGDRTVIVCLVDDIRSCSQDKHTDLPYLFDNRTMVVTDGYIGCPTQYIVMNLPHSFFGIYYTVPADCSWQPDLAYTFSVNRIDVRRLKLMLELAKRIHLHKGLVNFNCQFEYSGQRNADAEKAGAFFDQHWQQLSEQDQSQWQASYRLLRPQMPLKNYSVEHDEIYLRSFVNIECETYSGDNSAAYSEKIFRLLTTPAPWTCYVGRYGVAYLESLGFDCMSDLIDHNHYDRLKEVENKNAVFVWKSLEVSKQIRTQDQLAVTRRCQIAATHNRELLKNFHASWPADFAAWQQQFQACIQ